MEKIPIDLSKVDERVLTDYLVKYDLETTGELETKVDRLSEYYQITFGENLLADCHTCQAVSNCKEDVCPFCGDGGYIEGAGPDVVGDGPAFLKHTKKEPPPMMIEEPTPTKKPNGIAHTTSAAIRRSQTTRLDNVQTTITSVALESDAEVRLNELCAEVERIKAKMVADVMAGHWDLGKCLASIFEAELFKLRKDDTGDVKYKAWSQFVANEFQISPSYSYQIMDVASTFTREQVEKVGVSKLRTLLKLPEPVRAELVTQAETMPRTELARKVHELAIESTAGRRETGRKRMPAPKPGAQPKGMLSVAMVIGRQRLPMTAGWVGGPAKRVADEPCALETLPDGCEIRYVLEQNKAGELVLLVDRQRPEAAPAEPAAPKRGRGRPRKEKPAKRPPGRPKGSRNRKA